MSPLPEPTDPPAAGPAGPPPGEAHDPAHHTFRERLVEAAEEAERLTGRHEETEEEVHHALHVRLARAVGGFFLIGVGIALLPLPGPGWVTIIVGLSLLPYAWAERTIRLIRRRVPGVPEEGRIPASTWVVMGALVVAASAVTILWGAAITDWLGDRWAGLIG